MTRRATVWLFVAMTTLALAAARAPAAEAHAEGTPAQDYAAVAAEALGEEIFFIDPPPGQEPHPAPVHVDGAAAHQDAGHHDAGPALPGGGRLAGVVIILIVTLFVLAAVIGPIVRAVMPEEVPPAHSHDEPPGTSGHHGASGQLNPDPGHGGHHGHH